MDLTIELRRTSQTPPDFLSDVKMRMFHSNNLQAIANVVGMIDWTKAKFASVTIVWGEELEDGHVDRLEKSAQAGS